MNSLIARLSGGTVEAVRREMMELLLGDEWPDDMADTARMLAAAEAKETEISKRRNFWLCTAKPKFPLTTVAAARLLSMHATTAAAERNWSAWGRNYTDLRNRLSKDRAEKLIFIKANMAE